MSDAKQSSSVGDLVEDIKWVKSGVENISRKIIAKAVYAISKLESREYIIKNKIGRKVSTEITETGINYSMLFK